MNYIDIISILFLFVVVAIGFVKKCNIGVLAIGSALILARLGGLSDSKVLAGFDAKLFITLVGVSFLFSVAQVNGTLELVAKKGIGLAGKRTYLVPVIIFLVAGFLTIIGPGNIAVGNLMTVVAVTIAVSMGENPLLFALAAKVAANGFTLSPLTPPGVLMEKLGTEAGFAGFEIPVMWNCILWSTILMIGFSIYYKIWKIKPADNNNISLKVKEHLNKQQWITIIGVLVMVVMVVGLNINVGLASFFVAAALVILGVTDEKKALVKVPWGTLLLICGVGVLMNVVIELGGLDLMSKGLLSIMTPKTAAPIIGISASILSFFSSTTGVVMPSMIPTLGPIVQSLGTGNAGFTELASVVITSSLSAAFSPASTGGGLILAAYMTASSAEDKDQEQNKLFGRLFLIAFVCVIANAILATIGIYGIIR